MYTLEQYGQMISDRVRTDAYEEALRRIVGPDSVVLDIGAGTGIFSLIACRLGARRVYAVDPSEHIHVAARIAVENGFSDRMVCFQGRLDQVTLPELADVVVSDLRGILPWQVGHIESIMDARNRCLKPGGVLIPRRDLVWCSLVEAPQERGRCVSPWRESPYGIKMNAAADARLNSWDKVRGGAIQTLAPPVHVADLDYMTIESTDLSGEIAFSVSLDGEAHGFAVWFETSLYDDVGFSSAPGQPEVVYGKAFFPLKEPVHARVGDRATLRLRAKQVNERYCWFWKWAVHAGGDPANVKGSGDQTTVFHSLPSEQVIQVCDRDDAPLASQRGAAVRTVLQRLDGRHRVADVAEELLELHPDVFADSDEAFDMVRRVASKYCDCKVDLAMPEK